MSDEPASKRGKFEEELPAGSAVLNADMSKAYEAALKEIDTVQAEIDTLNEKASEEILSVERKYNALRKPHYESRNEVIRKIPNFWVASFVNHPTLSTIINEEDEECLHYMTKLEVVEDYDDIKSGYKLSFHFDKNPFHDNDVISKEFFIGIQEPVSQTTQIQWKANKDLSTHRENSKTDVLSRTFFEWLVDNDDPTSDDIAEIIKDDVWPNPLQYFLTPGSEAGDFGEDDAEDDGADSDGDEHPDEEAGADGEQVDEEEE